MNKVKKLLMDEGVPSTAWERGMGLVCVFCVGAAGGLYLGHAGAIEDPSAGIMGSVVTLAGVGAAALAGLCVLGAVAKRWRERQMANIAANPNQVRSAVAELLLYERRTKQALSRLEHLVEGIDGESETVPQT